ncbi:uncharacterized protein LOC121788556 [Salvia splendens]|uniref:uncharacterized protein LOC121788556 n=1 Tax=Salvia splendens TaxID=180675 RepID=UPI001C25869B|nr:uncharacterized protein LOC121788556 [Salvia splendens]
MALQTQEVPSDRTLLREGPAGDSSEPILNTVPSKRPDGQQASALGINDTVKTGVEGDFGTVIIHDRTATGNCYCAAIYTRRFRSCYGTCWKTPVSGPGDKY